MTKPVVLVIRDGWGINEGAELDPEALGDATLLAETPVARRLQSECPTCLMTTHGGAVGLPDGQMGNSEVGHLNLGAGRVVYQQLTRIDRAIDDGSFSVSEVLGDAMAGLGAGNSLHLMGLCSDGGVHSSLDHLIELLKMARQKSVDDVENRASVKFVDRFLPNAFSEDDIQLSTGFMEKVTALWLRA